VFFRIPEALNMTRAFSKNPASTSGCCEGRFSLRRRTALFGLGAAMAMGSIRMARAATASPARLIVINTLGGLDGLSMVAPYGDPKLAALRASIMAPAVGKPGGMLDLGGFFGLHPAMPNLHAMFTTGEAAFVHAVGNAAYSRSHFESQDYLQSGAPELLTSGWLNRTMGMVAGNGTMQSGISVGTEQGLLTQGPTIAAGWAPDPFWALGSQTAASLQAMLAPDPLLGPAYAAAFEDSAMFNAVLGAAPIPAGLSTLQQNAWAAGSFLAAPNGPRIAAIDADGFDTHDNQVTRLNAGLADLDAALLILKTRLGATWANTVVMTITEFGRTAASNGNASTGGTDHGTAFAMLLAGGAVSGGKVLGTWPGLASAQLYQGRDLMPTTDFRAIAMGILGQHMGLSGGALASVFPSAGLQAVTGLVKS
jgi:uncharacterized protein (DUF1501 family)